MSSSSRYAKSGTKHDNLKEREEKRRSPSPIQTRAHTESAITDLVGELKQLRKENQQGHVGTKESLTRLETSVGELKDQISKLETRIVEAEERIGNNEDSVMRHGRAIRHLLLREVELSARCDDLQNRLRRNNLRIYQVPENSEEGKNLVEFVKDLLTTTLNSLPDGDIRIERAHRALAPKPKNTESARSIVVKFTEFPVKEAILRQAWIQKQVMYKDKRIYFDNDYSPDLQRKRAHVRDVIRQLKTKNVRARSFYPAQLKISLDSGDKTFYTLTEAAPTLRELGIEMPVSEHDALETELSKAQWQMRRSGRRRINQTTLSDVDVKAFFSD